MVRIRMKRSGKRGRRLWHLVAADQRVARDGKVVEILGTYDPFVKDPVQQVSLKKDRVEYWLSKGAQPSVEAAAVLRRVGIKATGR